MTDLLLAVGFLIGIGCWLVPASRRDARGTAAAQLGRPAFGGRRARSWGSWSSPSGALVLRIARPQTLLWLVANSILGLTGIVLMLVVIGWAAT